MKSKVTLSGDLKRFRDDILKLYKDVNKFKHRMGAVGKTNIQNEFNLRWNNSTATKTSTGVTHGHARAGIDYRVTPNGVLFVSKAEYSSVLEKGMKRQQMKWLVTRSTRKGKKKRPIPIKDKKTGEIVFRWATEQGMRDGKWIHPGLKKDRNVGDGKGFFRAGIYKTKLWMRKEIRNLIKQMH